MEEYEKKFAEALARDATKPTEDEDKLLRSSNATERWYAIMALDWGNEVVQALLKKKRSVRQMLEDMTKFNGTNPGYDDPLPRTDMVDKLSKVGSHVLRTYSANDHKTTRIVNPYNILFELVNSAGAKPIDLDLSTMKIKFNTPSGPVSTGLNRSSYGELARVIKGGNSGSKINLIVDDLDDLVYSTTAFLVFHSNIVDLTGGYFRLVPGKAIYPPGASSQYIGVLNLIEKETAGIYNEIFEFPDSHSGYPPGVIIYHGLMSMGKRFLDAEWAKYMRIGLGYMKDFGLKSMDAIDVSSEVLQFIYDNNQELGADMRNALKDSRDWRENYVPGTKATKDWCTPHDTFHLPDGRHHIAEIITILENNLAIGAKKYDKMIVYGSPAYDISEGLNHYAGHSRRPGFLSPEGKPQIKHLITPGTVKLPEYCLAIHGKRDEGFDIATHYSNGRNLIIIHDFGLNASKGGTDDNSVLKALKGIDPTKQSGTWIINYQYSEFPTIATISALCEKLGFYAKMHKHSRYNNPACYLVISTEISPVPPSRLIEENYRLGKMVIENGKNKDLASYVGAPMNMMGFGISRSALVGYFLALKAGAAGKAESKRYKIGAGGIAADVADFLRRTLSKDGRNESAPGEKHDEGPVRMDVETPKPPDERGKEEDDSTKRYRVA